MASNRPKPSKVVALDYGMARIGVALSDERKVIASPLFTITTEKKSDQTIAKVLRELTRHQEQHHYVLETIVVGMPLLMNGKVGLLADEVKHFVALLSEATPVPIVVWDERLTTVQAERSLREGGLTRKQRATVVDTVSAAILLQSYLDNRSLKSQTDLL